MLLSAYGYRASQFELARAAGVLTKIRESGSRIDELAAAVASLFPGVCVFGKYSSTVSLLEELVCSRHIPVGVEWQGRFKADHGPFDIGHYCVVVDLNARQDKIVMVDPDPHAFWAEGPSLTEFEARWWEDNDMVNGDRLRTAGLLFAIAPDPNTRAV
ncbi:MAG: hypothetical protein ACRCYU_16685, partial [Nocardioides sp.]